MKSLLISVLLALLFSPFSFPQVAGSSSLNVLSEKWAISVEGGATYTRSDFRNSDFDYTVRLMGEFFFPTREQRIFGLRAFSSLGSLKGSGGAYNYMDENRNLINEFRTKIILLGGGIIYGWVINEKVFPYAYAGASYLYFDPRNSSGNRLPGNLRKDYSRHEPSLQAELGIRLIVEKYLSVNLNASMNYVRIDKLDDFRTGTDNDIFFSFNGGLSYYFGGIKDADKDGISDDADVCPETPQGVKVDQFGCAVDTDKDGVPDYLDRCPETRSNIVVDADGCPIDSDDDGISDYLDQCANTPANVPVDKRGCPFDKDDDGVPDYKDNCADTPPGTEVDKFGCPLKSQEKELPKITQLILSGEVNFEIGKSNLMPYANSMLNKLITVIKENPDTRWRVEGHTDNTGSLATNKRLSLERAWSVADYLISHGIESSRLQVAGLGPNYPIASNSTASGRAINRRVLIEMITGVATSEERYSTSLDGSEYNNSAERNVGSMIFTDGKRYTIQLSSWRSYEKALSEVDRLQARGENAFIIEVNNIEGLVGTWYRVRIGYFNTLQEARDYKAGMNY